jgi:hypothetical protein
MIDSHQGGSEIVTKEVFLTCVSYTAVQDTMTAS